MANTYGKQQVSQKGTVNYVYINTRVNEYQGKENGYAITFKFDDKYTKQLQGELESFLKETMTSDEGRKLKWSRDPYPGWTEDAEGNPVFKFKSIKKNADGTYKKVTLRDAHNNDLPLDTNIGSGSICRAIFTPCVYHNSQKDNGVTLYIDKLQVVKLEEYSGGSNLEFPEEDDGYETKPVAPEFPEEDLPF